MHSWYMGTLFIIIGAVISVFTVYFYVGAAFYTGPRDGTMLLFTKKSGWPVGLCRGLIDVTVSAAGFLMGDYPGLGTALNVLVTGPADAAGFPPVPFSFQGDKTRIAARYLSLFKSAAFPRFRKITQNARWGVFLLR